MLVELIGIATCCYFGVKAVDIFIWLLDSFGDWTREDLQK
jgi:hypothetical protein